MICPLDHKDGKQENIVFMAENGKTVYELQGVDQKQLREYFTYPVRIDGNLRDNIIDVDKIIKIGESEAEKNWLPGKMGIIECINNEHDFTRIFMTLKVLKIFHFIMNFIPTLFLALAPVNGVWAGQNVDTATTTGSESIDLSTHVDLKTLIALAFQDNPKLKSAKRRWEAVIEKYPQATAYEDPMLQYMRFIKKMEGRETQSFGIMQEVPFPGKLSLKGNIVEKEARIAQLDFEKETRDTIVELKDAYYELCYVDKAVEITRKNKDLAGQLAKIGETDYSVDGTTLNDVFKAQSQLAQLSYDLVLLTELRETQVARINSILNLAPETPLGRPEELSFKPFDYSLEQLYDLAKTHQQELAGSGVEIEKAGKEEDLAKMEYLPNFKFGFEYMDMGNGASGAGSQMAGGAKDAYTFNFGMTLPLWAGKNRARVEEAKLRQEAAVLDKKALENDTFDRIKTVYFKLKNSHRLVRLYKDSLIPQAAQSMETAETWYKEKKGSFSGLLETHSVWLNFNLAQQRALTDYYQRTAEMEKLVGVSLDNGTAETRRRGEERK